MKGLIGKKLGMSQVFDEAGKITPVTVIQAGPCTVVDVMTRDRDGYSAIQLGFGTKKAKNVSKAMLGHFQKAGLKTELPSVVKEFRTEKDPEVELGSVIGADTFKADEFLDVTGIVKGRGFQGVVKRYNFNGGRYSHGGGWKRRTGSIGQCEFPGRVDKGKKMPGHMGNVRRTIQNLRVVRVIPEENILFVKGAIPGPVGGTVALCSAVKKTNGK
ncbi:MAG: 50S ribosomal protein L3 [Victivallaceae bacterium]|nr:50S ribosomal protein L3 [Victivallaceae bacterium]